jgi:hypothetical protein
LIARKKAYSPANSMLLEKEGVSKGRNAYFIGERRFLGAISAALQFSKPEDTEHDANVCHL